MRGGTPRRVHGPAAQWPAQADIDRLDAETVVRLLHAWQDEEGAPLSVSVRGLADHIRSRGLKPDRGERLTDALSRLETAGVLGRSAGHATASSSLVTASVDERLLRSMAQLPDEAA